MIHHQTVPFGDLSYNVTVHRNRRFGKHFHRGHELIYVMKGGVAATVGDREFRLETGDFAMILSNEVHRLYFDPDTTCWICVFLPEFVPAFEKTVHQKIGAAYRFCCQDSVLAFLKEHVLVEAPDTYQLTAGVYLACHAYLQQVPLVERTNREYTLMNQIADFVGANYRSHLSLQDVASTLGYDYHYVSRRFRYIFNMSFSEYLNSFRVSAAMQALRNTGDTVASIASASGFQSVRSFNGVFQRVMGMTPVQYRDKFQKKH